MIGRSKGSADRRRLQKTRKTKEAEVCWKQRIEITVLEQLLQDSITHGPSNDVRNIICPNAKIPTESAEE